MKVGHEVMLSNSRGPQTLYSDRGVIGCEIGTIDEAARFGDIVVVAITMKHYQAVPVDPLVGKIVIDTNNYYSGRDDGMPALEEKKTTSSELLAGHHANASTKTITGTTTASMMTVALSRISRCAAAIGPWGSSTPEFMGLRRGKKRSGTSLLSVWGRSRACQTPASAPHGQALNHDGKNYHAIRT